MAGVAALYLTDAEIAKRLGLEPKQWAAVARRLERDGLVAPDAVFDNKRYWPAVVAFLDRRNGLGGPSRRAASSWEEIDGKSTRAETSTPQ